MSRYLISSDSEGTNDPYVTIRCFQEEKKTSIKHGNVFGMKN